MFRSILLLSLIAAPAMAFEARNGINVIGSADQIEVQPSAGQAAPQSWCAAGDYVMRGLGLPAETPIYRLSAPPRRGGESVLFGVGAGPGEKTGLFRFGAADNAVSAAHARGLCNFGRWRF